MIQPTLEVIQTARDTVDAFRGYNHNLRIADGEFYDMKNLTSTYYPILSPREKRGLALSPQKPLGLIAKDSLCYIDGKNFVIDEYSIDLGLSSDAEMCPKQLVSMGAYVIIMPDKKYINTKDLTEYGSIESSYTSSSTVSYELCKVDGTAYPDVTVSNAEPEEADNADLWIDTSTTPHTLKQYSSASAVWTNIATTYVKIKSPGIASAFRQYDGVLLSGIDSSITQLKDLEGQTSVLWDVYKDEDGNGAGDYLVVVGFLDNVTKQDAPLTVKREMPNLDFIIEANNRLWGCRYGTAKNGEIVNEIYASKQGDFKNWNCYMGLSTDSYTASCGTDGQWTGAVAYLGYPLFFKEDFMHKVYGNYPSNYQIQSTACRGVQKGCGNSLAIVNEKLYYKSRTGVCVYDGSLPSEVSYYFGGIKYTGTDSTITGEWGALRNGAVAGSIHNKYYITMNDETDGKWYLFVYDASSGMWHKEDETRADAFCACRGELYYLDHSDQKIKAILGSGSKESDPISWMAETGVIGTSMPDKKYVSRLVVRMSLGIGTTVEFYAQYDSCGEWELLSSMTGTNLRSFSVPVKPKRCDHFRFKIVGTGDAKIYSITKTIEQGSDL